MFYTLKNEFYRNNIEKQEIMQPKEGRPLLFVFSIGEHMILVPLRSNLISNNTGTIKRMFILSIKKEKSGGLDYNKLLIAHKSFLGEPIYISKKTI